MRNLKETNILLTMWKLLSREKPLWGSQTQDIHYLEDKTSNKALALTYPLCSGHTVHSDVYLYTNTSQPGLLPEGVFNGILYLRAPP
jgi:hypothetical protein